MKRINHNSDCVFEGDLDFPTSLMTNSNAKFSLLYFRVIQTNLPTTY